MVYELPALVLFQLLGIPESDVQKIKTWADSRLILSFGRPSLEESVDRSEVFFAVEAER